ncbi:unnamed protein product, partial [Nesidiocoris tenuis]
MNHLDQEIDDISLEEDLNEEMFFEQNPDEFSDPDVSTRQNPPTHPELESEALRVQAAKSSDEVFVRYLEEFKQQMEAGFGQLANKIQDLDRKYLDLSQQ